MHPPRLSVPEAVVNFDFRADTREQCRIQAGQEEIGIRDDGQTVEHASVYGILQPEEATTHILEPSAPWWETITVSKFESYPTNPVVPAPDVT